VSEEELKAMDEEIEGIQRVLPTSRRTHTDAALRQETTALRAQLKDIQVSLSSLKSTPSISSLNDSVSLLDPEVRELEDTLAILQASATKPVDSVEKAAAEVAYKRIEKVYLKRRKQFREFWAMVCDSIDGDPTELWVSSRFTFYPSRIRLPAVRSQTQLNTAGHAYHLVILSLTYSNSRYRKLLGWMETFSLLR